MVQHEDENLIRAHEDRMKALEQWCNKLETKVDKIPWILLTVVINLALSVLSIMIKK